MQLNQQECRRCGTCCASGGPALHSEDKKLILSGHMPLAQLITIRKGELAHNPLSNSLEPVKQELIKISGVGRDWNCLYFDPEEKGCTIYDKRPEACKALQCWDTSAIEMLIEKDTLSRLDVISLDDPIRPFIDEHEKRFPCPDMFGLLESGPSNQEAAFEDLANDEVKFRSAIVAKFNLSLGEELFYFGRPLFHLFVSLGAKAVEVEQRLIISWPRKMYNKG